MTKEEISKAMATLAKYRWKNTPKEQRIAHSRKMHKIRNQKRPPKSPLEKLKRTPLQRLANNLRKRLKQSLKHKGLSKNNTTMLYIGCTKLKLRKHLEKQFGDGMSWENYGEWEVDHIKPFAKFNLNEEREIFKVMSYKNLQPLWKHENRTKSARY